MKGRIIGREGRNIRSFETITGVDVIIDDTPEAVILSGFDPVRREIARLALERLVADGRIHPARIEEVVAEGEEPRSRARSASWARWRCLEVGRPRHPPRARSSCSAGSTTAPRTARTSCATRSRWRTWPGMMAAEIGMDQKMAKRGGLLHDIGKAIDHDQEGTHPALGMEVAARYGEPQPVLEAIGYHHDDYAGGSLWPVLVSAADAVSGRAARRAAREPRDLHQAPRGAREDRRARSPASRSRTPSRPGARSASWSSTRASTTRARRTWRARSRAGSRRSCSTRARSASP